MPQELFDPLNGNSKEFSELSTKEREQVSTLTSPEFTRCLEIFSALDRTELAGILIKSMANLTGSSEASIVSSLLSQTDSAVRESRSQESRNSGER